jgi:hypothetical protein
MRSSARSAFHQPQAGGPGRSRPPPGDPLWMRNEDHAGTNGVAEPIHGAPRAIVGCVLVNGNSQSGANGQLHQTPGHDIQDCGDQAARRAAKQTAMARPSSPRGSALHDKPWDRSPVIVPAATRPSAGRGGSHPQTPPMVPSMGIARGASGGGGVRAGGGIMSAETQSRCDEAQPRCVAQSPGATPRAYRRSVSQLRSSAEAPAREQGAGGGARRLVR